MNKMRMLASLLIPLIISCNTIDKQEKTSPENKMKLSVFPVTEFLKGQLKEVEKSPVTPLMTTIWNGHVDSVWISRDSIRSFATPFLSPVIDSVNLTEFFNGDSFMDQTINSITLSYEANEKLPEDISLRTIDIYVEPIGNTITKVYLLKESNKGETSTTNQLTWITNKSCRIVTISRKGTEDPVIKEEKIEWAF